MLTKGCRSGVPLSAHGLCVLRSWTALGWTTATLALTPGFAAEEAFASTEASAHEESGASEGEAHNAVSIKGSYAFQLHRDRRSGVAGEEAPDSDSLGGFVLAYERVLLPDVLGVEFAKPFYFAPGRFDSPFDLMLKLFHRWGPVEPFLAVGTTFNIRVFDGDRKEVEDRPNDLSFGVLTGLGAVYWFDDRWALELEVGYAYIPIGEVVEHEITAGLGPVLAF